nr:MAG TPA: hypothetical protein [Caudoviricetes sp.]
MKFDLFGPECLLWQVSCVCWGRYYFHKIKRW